MRITVFCLVVIFALILVVGPVLSAKVPLTLTSCPIDHYAVLNENRNGISACRVCDSCPPGYGVVRPCSPTENTVCGLCESGTFSTTMNSQDECERCNPCQGTGILEECSPVADAVCQQQCDFGEYYNPTLLTCEQCSYCFPDRLYAQTNRVLDCQRQGLHIDYQCSPLPDGDAVDTSHARVVTADRHRSATAARRHGGRIGHIPRTRTRIFGDQSGGTDTKNGKYQDIIHPSIIPLFRRTEGPPLYQTTTVRSENFSSQMRTSEHSAEDATQVNAFESSSKDSKGFQAAGNVIIMGRNEYNVSGVPRTGMQESKIPFYKSMTSTDIILLIAIVIMLMLISIAMTGIACYCWIGKRNGVRKQKVVAISAKPPSNAWTYQDMMPRNSTNELRPLVNDTPPQSRKLTTCV